MAERLLSCCEVSIKVPFTLHSICRKKYALSLVLLTNSEQALHIKLPHQYYLFINMLALNCSPLSQTVLF